MVKTKDAHSKKRNTKQQLSKISTGWKKQVGNSKAHLTSYINLTKKHSRYNVEKTDTYSKDEKIINNTSNKYIYRNKYVCHNDDQIGPSTSSIYSLLE